MAGSPRCQLNKRDGARTREGRKQFVTRFVREPDNAPGAVELFRLKNERTKDIDRS
jgi:hypothetical protein